jgi:hypothetical protein
MQKLNNGATSFATALLNLRKNRSKLLALTPSQTANRYHLQAHAAVKTDAWNLKTSTKTQNSHLL